MKYSVRCFHCSYCGGERQFRRSTPDHRLHLLFTAITFGLWSVPWTALAIRGTLVPWVCRTCRRKRSAADRDPLPASPAPAPAEPAETPAGSETR